MPLLGTFVQSQSQRQGNFNTFIISHLPIAFMEEVMDGKPNWAIDKAVVQELPPLQSKAPMTKGMWSRYFSQCGTMWPFGESRPRTRLCNS